MVSWKSTAIYYRLLNEIVRERLGGLHSAKLLLWSFDFAEIAERQHAGDWQGAGVLLIEAARKLEAGGAEGLLICTNTMHKLADQVQAAVSIPLIHIADATAVAVKGAGVAGRRCWRRASPWKKISTRAGWPTNMVFSRWCRTRPDATWCTG